MIEETIHILTDPAHMVAELLSEGVFLGLGILANVVLLRRRDRRHGHG